MDDVTHQTGQKNQNLSKLSRQTSGEFSYHLNISIRQNNNELVIFVKIFSHIGFLMVKNALHVPTQHACHMYNLSMM